ncbi:hypothetical protein TrVGV298_010989 [Trichoderma virens]|nr:hypothetical protein TrVGV298_010989 [Trichoderma virens]
MGRPRRGSARGSAPCVKDFTPKDHGSRQDASLGSNSVYNMSRLTVLILFALNTERPPREMHKIGGHKWFESISCLVSSLCEITSRLQGQRSSIFGGANISPCLLLVVSVVSNVIQVYEVALESLKSSWKAPTQQPNLHEKLQILADASTMEFHLVSLRRIYDHSILDMPSKYAGQRLDKLLGVLQQCIQQWRLLDLSAAPGTEFAGMP